MSYPSAPWTLKGYAVQTLQFVDSARARSFVPADLDIVSVLPGKTLGGVYLASYGPGSILRYNELIVVAALTRYGRKLGFWISHIYVDHPDSMAGGREIWGLPKELARFTWQTGDQSRVEVRQGERVLCSLHYGRQRRLWRQPTFFPALSMLGGDLLRFRGTATARLGLGRGRVEVPTESPFATLGLTRATRTYHLDDMTFVAHSRRSSAGPLRWRRDVASAWLSQRPSAWRPSSGSRSLPRIGLLPVLPANLPRAPGLPQAPLDKDVPDFHNWG